MDPNSNIKLLIIDDDPIYRKLVKKILRPWKIDVFSAQNMAQATDILLNQHFSICFVDGELGDGHGLNLISWMNQELVQIPKIAFISSGDYNNTEELKRTYPIEFFLSKPINRQEITQVVSAFLCDHDPIGEEPFLTQIRQEYESSIPQKIDRIAQLIEIIQQEQSEHSLHNLKFELLRISENSVHYGYQRIHIIADQKCEEINLLLKNWPPSSEWFKRLDSFLTQIENGFQLRQFKPIQSEFYSGEQLSASNPNVTYLVSPSQRDYPNIVQALHDAGSTVVWESNPKVALRYLQEEHFDGAMLICAPHFENSLLTGSEIIERFQLSQHSSRTTTILIDHDHQSIEFKGKYLLQDHLDPIFLKEFFLQNLNPVVFEPWRVLNLSQLDRLNHIIKSDSSLSVQITSLDHLPVVNSDWLKHPPRLICLNTCSEHLTWLKTMNQIAAMSYTSFWVFGTSRGATPKFSNLEVCWFDETPLRRPLLLPLLRQLIKLDHLHSAIHTQEEHTELYTRASFTELFQISFSRVQRSKQHLNLAIVDVHALNRLNQSQYFKGSHEVVRQIGQFFKDQFRKTDIICRWHGSLFAFFFEGITPRTTQFIMEKLIHNYQEWDAPFTKDQISKLSIGISHFPEYGKDLSTLIENAMISLEIAQIAPTSKAVLSKDLADLDHYGQQQHKVLLLDSNKDIQTMLHYGFSLRSFNMKTMTSGTETLDFLRHRTDWGLPDLIILDRELNDMDGVDVLETIHSERLCSAPIVFLSAKCTEEQILRGLKAGAADYVTKPFSLDIFITKCQKLLGVQ